MIKELTLGYTREAGVRNCEREIAKICRKVALLIAEGKLTRLALKSTDQLKEYLGTARFDYSEIERQDAIGVVTGVVWTSVGGDVQTIEASFMPGKGDLILTGQLGDVMKESCKAALTYCRSNSAALGIDNALFSERDVHLHFPAGAIPKDGPSAGITIATAIISLFTQRKVKSSIAMTGEITLKGRALPVGGLKEKMLGAKRAGVRRILVPKDNAKDIADIPEEIRQGMEVIYVAHLDDVLKHVFPARTTPAKRAATAKPVAAANPAQPAGRRVKR